MNARRIVFLMCFILALAVLAGCEMFGPKQQRKHNQDWFWSGQPAPEAAGDPANGAFAFHEYCGRCHGLPDLRYVDVPPLMYQYILSFGATPREADDIRAYAKAMRR